MNTTQLALLDAINPTRIEEELKVFAAMSSGPIGVSRLAYSELERRSHKYFLEYMTGLGLSFWTDSAGNTLAEYSSDINKESACLATGSHLDSVPDGGRYDGIVGVVASMEIARILSEGKISLKKPWRFIAFAAEEGARFGQACNGSRAIAGLATPQALGKSLDKDGISLAKAMEKVGFNPDLIEESKWAVGECEGFIELHIEQGNVLESASTSVGIVDVISGSQRLLVTVVGEAAHSGGTPMNLRRDALLTASKAIVALDVYSHDSKNAGIRITVGRITTLPGSITTVPGWVEFTVDIRDFKSERQSRVLEEVSEILRQASDENGTALEIKQIGETNPIELSSQIVETIQKTSQNLNLKTMILPSGASHDCQNMARITASGLIFVPSISGHSHIPSEFSSIENIAAGTKLLFASLLELDQTIAFKNGEDYGNTYNKTATK